MLLPHVAAYDVLLSALIEVGQLPFKCSDESRVQRRLGSKNKASISHFALEPFNLLNN